MKKLLVSFLPILFPLIVAGYCPSGDLLGNATICCASGLSSNPDDITALVWIQGKADWTTNGNDTGVSPGNCTSGSPVGGCDSDGMGAVATDCDWLGDHVLITSDCAGVGSAVDYFLWTDWYTSQYDGCPSVDSSERAILLIYDTSGKYVLQSRSKGKDWCNWDEIGTTEARNWNSGFSFSGFWDYDTEFYCQLHLDVSTVDAFGNYSPGDAPAAPLITGYRVYFYNDCQYPPTNFSTGSWVPGPVYPIGTTNITIYESDIPVCGSSRLLISPALIIDGRESPVVSTNYTQLVDFHVDIWDGYPCQCGAFYVPNEITDNTGNYAIGHIPTELSYSGVPGCGVEHSFTWRAFWGGWTSCWSDPFIWNEPSDTVINSISDNDPNSLTGVTINFTPTVPASRHDLYVDGNLVKTGILPGETYSGGLLSCNTPHTFQIAAQVDWAPLGYTVCDTYWSNTIAAIDWCAGVPGELAPGLSSSDIQSWSSDKATQSWPSLVGTTGYRLYRGTKSQLASLATGSVNSCLKYDGVSTSQNLSLDDPSGVTGRFYWYLVTAYNGSGEGPAGTGRVINSSGGCP